MLNEINWSIIISKSFISELIHCMFYRIYIDRHIKKTHFNFISYLQQLQIYKIVNTVFNQFEETKQVYKNIIK